MAVFEAKQFRREEIFLSLTLEEREFLKYLPESIPEEQILELKRLAQVIGGDFGMKVEIGEPGKGSFFNPERCEIIFDPSFLADDLSKARMIMAHEGAHRRLSRGPKSLGVKQELIEKLYGEQIGFAYIANCIEDPTVNKWVGINFEGLRGDFDKTYRDMFVQENIPLGLEHPEIQAIIQRTGTIPNVVWAGSELIRYWHKKRFSKGLKENRPKVIQALAQILKPFIKAHNAFPAFAYQEENVLEAARQRFQIVYREIWPRLQSLIEEDQEKEEKRLMLEEGLRQKKRERGTEGISKDLEEGKTGTSLDNLPEQLRKELAELLKKTDQTQKEAQGRSEKELKEKEEALEKESREIKEKKEELEERKKTAKDDESLEIREEEKKLKICEDINKEQQEQLQKEKDRQKKTQEEIAKEGILPLEMNNLSKELRQELNKAFDHLPEEEKKRLREKAERTLRDLEDRLNKTMRGKLNSDQPESHAQFRARKEEEKEIREEKKRRDQEFEEARRRAEELAEESKSEYDKIRTEMDEGIENLYRRLESFFLRERNPKWRKGHHSGQRLTLKKAMDFTSGAHPEAYSAMWERKTVPQKFNYKFSFVVDLSASMLKENKIEETRKGLILLAEVLNRLGIDFEIIIFNNRIGADVLKDFDREFDEEVQGKIAGLIGVPKETDTTPTSLAMRTAYSRLLKHAGRSNFIVPLTDGVPFPESSDLTKEFVKKILQDQEIPVQIVGIGLGKNTDFVESLFPFSISNIKAEDLVQTLGDLLEEMIINPQNFEIIDKKE